MRNQIHLREAWRFYVPAVRLYWNVVLPQYSRLGAPIDFPLLLPLAALEAAVHLARAHGLQLLLQLRTQPVAFADPGHPIRQQRLQPHRPGIARRFPHRGQNRNHLLAVLWLTFSWPPSRSFSGRGPFSSRIAYLRLYLVVTQNSSSSAARAFRFALWYRSYITRKYSHFASFPKSNSPLEFLWSELGYILRVSTASPRVTF